MLLEVKQYGDFDIEQTYSTHEVPENFDIRMILADFAKEKNLKDCQISNTGITGLSYDDMKSNVSAKFCRYLKKKGYPLVKTKEVSFCD